MPSSLHRLGPHFPSASADTLWNGNGIEQQQQTAPRWIPNGLLRVQQHRPMDEQPRDVQATAEKTKEGAHPNWEMIFLFIFVEFQKIYFLLFKIANKLSGALWLCGMLFESGLLLKDKKLHKWNKWDLWFWNGFNEIKAHLHITNGPWDPNNNFWA